MPIANLRCTPALISLALLAACGGGGGGGGGTDVIPFTSFDNRPQDGTIELQGAARTARFDIDPATGELSLSNISSAAEDSTLRITYENGQGTALRVSAPDSQAAFDLMRDSILDMSNPPVLLFESDNGDRFALLVEGGPTEYFNYQMFGLWMTGLTGLEGTTGAGAYGAPTPVSGIPGGTVAVYRGDAVGFATDASGAAYLTFSLIDIETDFSDIEIISSGTTTVSLDDASSTPEPGFDFSGTGKVSGATFTAPVSGPLTSGTAEGEFHGPNAEEVAGTYSLSGPNGVRQFGAFGAN